MVSSKVFLILSVLVAVSYGKWVKVKSGHSTALVVTIGGTDYTMGTGEVVALDVGDEWSATITAVPVGAEVFDGPKTRAELSLSASGDSYSVSLADGFNLPVKVVPNSSTRCIPSHCAANILKVCPLANQVTNSLGRVVACQNSPLVMNTLCPLAIVDESTSIRIQTCATATSYLVMFV